jgi:transcription antitermination protein NusB
MKPRRQARVVALQTLYEVDSTEHAWQAAFDYRATEERLPEPAWDFARSLVAGVVQNTAVLDEIIGKIAPEWPLDLLPVIDRNVLRIAIYEVLLSNETPLKVAINEAIDLAKEYGGDTTPRFINGALGTLAERKNEFLQLAKRSRPSTSTVQG